MKVGCVLSETKLCSPWPNLLETSVGSCYGLLPWQQSAWQQIGQVQQCQATATVASYPVVTELSASCAGGSQPAAAQLGEIAGQPGHPARVCGQKLSVEGGSHLLQNCKQGRRA